VLSAVVLAAGAAGCKSRPPAPAPRERYASDGAVSAQLLVRPSTESYALVPGTVYRGGTAAPGNAMPQYPDGLLSMMLPPVTLAVRVVVGTEGTVTKAAITDPADPDPAFAAALLSTVSGWKFAPLERVSADKVEVLPFSQEYGFTFRQVNGRAVVDPVAKAR
jgi:outer membrane biosynthesis protein TonB